MKKAIILAMTLAAGVAQANTNSTGYELLQNLNRTESTYLKGVAHGMISGIASGRDDICVPKNVTNGQMTNVVKYFLDTSPSIQHQGSDLLIYMALIQAFPCPKTNKGTSL